MTQLDLYIEWHIKGYNNTNEPLKHIYLWINCEIKPDKDVIYFQITLGYK